MTVTRDPRPWSAGSVTGVGSLPGTDVRDALHLVHDALPLLPHLPELPARGPGADMVGRALALLPDFAATWGPRGWEVTDRRGADSRRGVSLLGEDLDQLEELFEGWDGAFKIQVCGPWTVAATVELRSGRRLVADPGARRDLTQAYAEGLARHVAEVAHRLPLARLLVQLDEPALTDVLRGGLPTPSGWGRLSGIEEPYVLEALRRAVDALPPDVTTVAHTCAAEPPLRLLRSAGFGALSVDASLLTLVDDEPLGEAVEAGLGLFLGVVPTDGSPGPGRAVVSDLWNRLGQDPGRLAEVVVVTPACGLAGATPDSARAILVRCTEIARSLRDDPEAGPGPQGRASSRAEQEGTRD